MFTRNKDDKVLTNFMHFFHLIYAAWIKTGRVHGMVVLLPLQKQNVKRLTPK
jgi:hypothetical protein